MKNVIKKIAAAAMAFTLIGGGTAIAKTVAPETAAPTTITASAAHSCSAHVRYSDTLQFTGLYRYSGGRWQKQYVVIESAYCLTCGRQVSQRSWIEWRNA